MHTTQTDGMRKCRHVCTQIGDTDQTRCGAPEKGRDRWVQKRSHSLAHLLPLLPPLPPPPPPPPPPLLLRFLTEATLTAPHFPPHLTHTTTTATATITTITTMHVLMYACRASAAMQNFDNEEPAKKKSRRR